MQGETLKRVGIVLVFVGIFGFLLINVSIIGFAVSSGIDILDTNTEEKSQIEISDIEKIIARKGDQKTISLTVKNNNKNQLTNCQLISSGTVSSWIYSDNLKDIQPKELTDFTFNINIPEGVQPTTYQTNLEINCDQDSNSQELIISILDGLDTITVKNIETKRNVLNIDYVFDNTNFIGYRVDIEIWVTNEENLELNRITDNFPINKDDLIERNIILTIPKGSIGFYNVFFALSSDLENYLEESILIGESSSTGNAIFNLGEGKVVPFFLFILVIAIGVFLIFLSHRKSIQNTNERLVRPNQTNDQNKLNNPNKLNKLNNQKT